MGIFFRGFLAYLLSSIVFIAGIFLGILWVELYKEPLPENVIDLPQLLAEQMAPAIVSVVLSNLVFQKIFPEIKKRSIAENFLYAAMLLYFLSLVPGYYAARSYSDFIFVVTGIIAVGAVFYYSRLKCKEAEKYV